MGALSTRDKRLIRFNFGIVSSGCQLEDCFGEQSQICLVDKSFFILKVYHKTFIIKVFRKKIFLTFRISEALEIVYWRESNLSSQRGDSETEEDRVRQVENEASTK